MAIAAAKRVSVTGCMDELDKKSFKRLLGPIEDILQKNTNSYNNINYNNHLYY